MDLLANIWSFPEPANLDGGPRGRFLLEQWRRYMPHHPNDDRGDPEDFWEMAARLDAALHSGADRVYLYDGNRKAEDRARDAATRHWVPIGVLFEQVRTGQTLPYGPVGEFSPLERLVDRRADRYQTTTTFTDNAGRKMILAGFRPNTGIELADAMADLAADGYDEAIIKAVRAKHGLWRVPISPNPAVNEETLFQHLDWALIQNEGSPATYLVQQVIDMTHEYRLFIVDGHPVTGAACIEEHTPLDANPGDQFSPLVRARRGTNDPIVTDRAIVDRLLRFGRTVTSQATLEGSMPRAYVLDVALSADKPVVVEMNSIENAGLYASDPLRVTQALLRVPATI